METKTCSKCNTPKPVTEFHRRRLRNGRTSWCKRCKAEIDKANYQANRKAIARRKIEIRHQKKRRWEDYKSTLKCSRCPMSHPAALLFHHKKKDKEANLSDVAQSWGWARLMKEVAKCDVLCANCHLIEHYDRRKIA